MSLWKAKKSLEEEIGLYSMMSSANIWMLASWDKGKDAISFRCNKKSNGPRIEPCGTADLTGNHVEQLPLRTTLWKRQDK